MPNVHDDDEESLDFADESEWMEPDDEHSSDGSFRYPVNREPNRRPARQNHLTHDVEDWGGNPDDRAGIIAHLSQHPEHAWRYPPGFDFGDATGLAWAVTHRRHHEATPAPIVHDESEWMTAGPGDDIEPNPDDPPSPQADLLDRLINREIPDVDDLAATGELTDGWAAYQWIDTGRGDFTVLVVDGSISREQMAAIQAILAYTSGQVQR
jgi:hypothetical protein